MNNRFWNQNTRGRFNRGGFNRGGRGGNRGWSWNRGGFNGPNANYDGFFGGNRYQKDFFPKPKQWKNKQKKKEKKQSPGKRLSEDLIGVTEYISDHEGFNGIIKSRYSDFQVAEMNEKGEIAKLTDRKPPQRPTDATVDADEDLILNKYNLEILPMETWDKINSLTAAPIEQFAMTHRVEIDMEGVSKEQRTKIHDAVKKAFGDSIVGSTVNVDNKKFMRFEKYRKGVRIDTRVKWVWPGEYVYFIVHKENCDTMEAATRIAERIGISLKASSIGYAGTKDRRAKTSQWFSVRRVEPSRIASCCKQLRDIQVGNYSFGAETLKLGMLKGNKFRIALRNITADEECVDIACQHLKEKGFINYYGLQRFGSRVDTPTFDIGLKLLQGKYKEAIDSILEPREDGPLVHVLRAYRERGAGEAAALLPPRAATSEARLIRALAAAPNDLVGALNRLARNIRLLYLHSYQSLVWNRAVSERIRRFGLKPVAGDCVPLPNVEIKDPVQDDTDSEDGEEEEEDSTSSDTTSKAGSSPAKETPETEESPAKETPETEESPAKDPASATDDKATTEAPVAPDTKTPVKNGSKKKKQKKEEPKPPLPIKILTQEDVDSGKYNVFNIVLPLPGAFVEYPPNLIDFYEEVLTKDGLKMDMKHKLKSYSLAGAYRHMVVRPLCVSWEHVRYSDPFADLIASDRDEMDNRLITGIVEDGIYRALILNMILPSSCYATMALRELLKVDTSSDNQALQNNYHKKKKGKKGTSESTNKTGDTSESESQPAMEDEAEDKDTGDDGDDEEEEELESEGDDKSEDNAGEKRKLEDSSEENVKKQKTDE